MADTLDLTPSMPVPESSPPTCTHFWQAMPDGAHNCGWCGEQRTVSDTNKHYRALFDELHAMLDSFGVTTGGLPTERVARVLAAWEEDRRALRDARIQMVALKAERDAVREAAHASEWRGWCDECRRATTQEIGRACPDCGLRTTPKEEA